MPCGLSPFPRMCVYPLHFDDLYANPHQVLKSRLQSAPEGTYAGFMDCARKTIAADGIGALWKGFGPAMSRAFPANAATFVRDFPCSIIASSFLPVISSGWKCHGNYWINGFRSVDVAIYRKLYSESEVSVDRSRGRSLPPMYAHGYNYACASRALSTSWPFKQIRRPS